MVLRTTTKLTIKITTIKVTTTIIQITKKKVCRRGEHHHSLKSPKLDSYLTLKYKAKAIELGGYYHKRGDNHTHDELTSKLFSGSLNNILIDNFGLVFFYR